MNIVSAKVINTAWANPIVIFEDWLNTFCAISEDALAKLFVGIRFAIVCPFSFVLVKELYKLVAFCGKIDTNNSISL